MPRFKTSLKTTGRLPLSIVILGLAMFIPGTTAAQQAPPEDAVRLQAGISALPVFDALHLYPENQIGGAAVMGNFGCFVHPRISFGINPYLAMVSNTYPTVQPGTPGERQDMRLLGLNAYLRGYLFTRGRLSVYLMGSAGFSVIKEEVRDLTDPANVQPVRTVYLPAAALFGGVGVSWNLMPWLAAEANLPYAMVYRFDGAENDLYFSTVLPTVGLQFSWQGN